MIMEVDEVVSFVKRQMPPDYLEIVNQIKLRNGKIKTIKHKGWNVPDYHFVSWNMRERLNIYYKVKEFLVLCNQGKIDEGDILIHSRSIKKHNAYFADFHYGDSSVIYYKL